MEGGANQQEPKSAGYLNQSFPGVKIEGIKGKVKRGRGVGEGTRPEGERGGRMREKGGRKGARRHT